MLLPIPVKGAGLRALALRLTTPHALLAAALALACPAPAHAQATPAAFSVAGLDFLADAPDALTLGAGAFNVIPNDDRADTGSEVRVEYRVGRKWHSLGPIVGVLANNDGGVYGYAGLYTDIRLGSRWIMTPAGGIGAYERGEGKDLSGVFQFHLGLDLAYALRDGNRLGLKLAHISNAWTHDKNPGEESLLLTYTISLGGMGLFGP